MIGSTTEIKDNLMLEGVLAMLPAHVAAAIRQNAPAEGVSEIRLRLNGQASLTTGRGNVILPVRMTREDMETALRNLCERSLYAKAGTICDGFITAAGGYRVGVCGRAVVRDGEIVSVAQISSLNIRVPRAIPGCADRLWRIMRSQGFRRGALVWSVPGMGKTTLLRELSRLLASGRDACRVAVVDTRSELGTDAGLADVLTSYPRSKGIEIAKRTLAPQIIVCDEIAGEEDCLAILEAYHAGITVCASAHASSYRSLMASKQMQMLRSSGVFGTYYGLIRQLPGGYEAQINGSEPA